MNLVEFKAVMIEDFKSLDTMQDAFVAGGNNEKYNAVVDCPDKASSWQKVRSQLNSIVVLDDRQASGGGKQSAVHVRIEAFASTTLYNKPNLALIGVRQALPI